MKKQYNKPSIEDVKLASDLLDGVEISGQMKPGEEESKEGDFDLWDDDETAWQTGSNIWDD